MRRECRLVAILCKRVREVARRAEWALRRPRHSRPPRRSRLQLQTCGGQPSAAASRATYGASPRASSAQSETCFAAICSAPFRWRLLSGCPEGKRVVSVCHKKYGYTRTQRT